MERCCSSSGGAIIELALAPARVLLSTSLSRVHLARLPLTHLNSRRSCRERFPRILWPGTRWLPMRLFPIDCGSLLMVFLCPPSFDSPLGERELVQPNAKYPENPCSMEGFDVVIACPSFYYCTRDVSAIEDSHVQLQQVNP